MVLKRSGFCCVLGLAAIASNARLFVHGSFLFHGCVVVLLYSHLLWSKRPFLLSVPPGCQRLSPTNTNHSFLSLHPNKCVIQCIPSSILCGPFLRISPCQEVLCCLKMLN